jgi:hypothetical protein
MQSTCYSSQILMKLEFSRQMFEKISNIRFYENPLTGSRVVACGRTDWCTDMQTEAKKVIVSSRNFGKAPQKRDRKVSLDSRSMIKTPTGNP